MNLFIFSRLSSEALSGIRRSLAASIAGIALSFTAFLMLGISILIYQTADHNAERISKLPEMEVFLYPDAGITERDMLREKLSDTEGIVSITFIDKDKAFERAKEILGEDTEVLDILGKEFLPESFLVDIDDGYDIENIASVIGGFDEAESLDYARDEVIIINRIARLSRSVSFAVFLAALLFTFVLISAIVRVTIYAREKDIRIKKLMGAGRLFIMLPFILEGVIISFIGAVASWAFLAFFYGKLVKVYASAVSGLINGVFETVPAGRAMYHILMLVTAAAVVFGFLSAFYSVWRHLRLGGFRLAL